MGSFDFPALAEQFGASETGKVLLAPFNVYGRVITAQRVFPEMLQWAAAAVVMNAVLLALVVRLDANYLEAAAGAAQRRYERLRRVRGGGAMALGRSGTVHRGLRNRRSSSAPARSPGGSSPTPSAAPAASLWCC